MKTWYVSGPMTGYTNFNYEAFDYACQVLRTQGRAVISPHEIKHDDGGIPGAAPWDSYLRNDLMALINGCTGIVLIQGWPESRGARLELEIALGLGLEVAFLDGWNFIEMSKAK